MKTQKKFAVFDIDGTLFRSGLYKELVEEFIHRDLFCKDEISRIREKEVKWIQNRSVDTFNEFDVELLQVFESKLLKLTCKEYEHAIDAVLNRHSNNIFTYTSQMAIKYKTDGYTLIAISGSPEELVKAFADIYGFDIVVGLRHERSGDAFTGNSQRTYGKKDHILNELVKKYDLGYSESIGMGDTAGDIKMLSLVDRPIAFNPDPLLLQHAVDHSWEIVVERKGSVYSIGDANNQIVRSTL